MVPEVLGSRISSTVAQWLDLRHLGPHRRVHRHSNPWGKARPQDVAGDGSMDDSMMSIKCIYDIVTYIYIVYSYLYNWRWIHDDRPSNERFKVNYIEFAHANYIYCRYAYVVTPKCQVERGDSISCLSWKDYAFSLARKYAADRPLWLAFCAGAPLPFAQTWLKTVS